MNVFILGIGSDIGKALARRYLKEGHSVTGTYRSNNSVADLRPVRDVRLIKCDISARPGIKRCINEYRKIHSPWDIFISCVGSMEPIGKFFDCEFTNWQRSVIINSLSQLHFLHDIYPYRRKNSVCHAAFFAGGGTNNAFTNYSAYCVSKIMLIKMCELLDDENKDMNIFIIGPGWVRTKIHDQTLKNGSRAGINYGRTLEFMKSGSSGTDFKKIYDCIAWCVKKGPLVSGGRNFSVVHDPWHSKGSALAGELRKDFDKFKLRRFKNS